MNQIQIISRNAIPPLHAVHQGGEMHTLGELRDFRWHDHLKSFMPAESEFSVSWVRLEPGEVLKAHVHPIQSLMVFYAGSGEVLGDLQRAVAKDDVLVVPPGCAHGFVGGPEGLYALSIQFGEGLYSVPESPRVLFEKEEHTLESLLAYNQKRLEDFSHACIFELLEDGTLDDPVKRKAYLDTLQIWVDGNQSLLFSRQAACTDPTFGDTFLRHMLEEMGHDVLHKDRADGSRREEAGARDAVMEAIANWFTYQMFVLDNVEKAALVHLVIENASVVYHRRAMPVLSKYVNDKYFEVHVDADEEHAALGVALVQQQSPRTYARLQAIVGEAWNMIAAMTDRVVEVTRGAG